MATLLLQVYATRRFHGDGCISVARLQRRCVNAYISARSFSICPCHGLAAFVWHVAGFCLPMLEAVIPFEGGSTHGCYDSRQEDGSRRADRARLQPMDPVRGLPAVHGRREG